MARGGMRARTEGKEHRIEGGPVTEEDGDGNRDWTSGSDWR